MWGHLGLVSTDLCVISVKKPPFPAPPGRRWIFVKYFKHWRSGKLVYPKTAECFCFLVRC